MNRRGLWPALAVSLLMWAAILGFFYVAYHWPQYTDPRRDWLQLIGARP